MGDVNSAPGPAAHSCAADQRAAQGGSPKAEPGGQGMHGTAVEGDVGAAASQGTKQRPGCPSQCCAVSV